MFYPYRERQTLLQFLLNTFDPRVWFRVNDCECSWGYFKPNLIEGNFKSKLIWIPLAGCPKHD